ncbi:hypothetical protein K505DRAFT_367859 [Melanomma pulvis-pyrius CBS 109.77]|uniref:Uncharacterized protein n=1 Tax=Melanomma pulvis-pyrius CBS 109.77 TaxID=1314802 RepID=A0A6A6WRZ8_9PLEO|nr:hypothetical protein K505DRAFT_367859 [Melanomma pulvis-pyrius CBS 109.77]
MPNRDPRPRCHDAAPAHRAALAHDAAVTVHGQPNAGPQAARPGIERGEIMRIIEGTRPGPSRTTPTGARRARCKSPRPPVQRTHSQPAAAAASPSSTSKQASKQPATARDVDVTTTQPAAAAVVEARLSPPDSPPDMGCPPPHSPSSSTTTTTTTTTTTRQGRRAKAPAAMTLLEASRGPSAGSPSWRWLDRRTMRLRRYCKNTPVPAATLPSCLCPVVPPAVALRQCQCQCQRDKLTLDRISSPA